MENFANRLAERYGGTVALPHECVGYLKEGQQLIFGIRLTNAGSNYKLLSEYDLMSLSAATRHRSVKTETSPFDNMLLIFYKTSCGEVEFKLLHGMASRLVAEMAELCTHAEAWEAETANGSSRE